MNRKTGEIMIHFFIKILGVIMEICFVAAATGAQPLAESRRLERLSEISRQQATEKFSQTLVQGNNESALNLYGRLREPEGNIFFSPFSVSSATG